MKILLDAQPLLSHYFGDKRLPKNVRDILETEQHHFVLSVVSVWEMAIKHAKGNLALTEPLSDVVDAWRSTLAVELLTVNLKHVLEIGALPLYHSDPFDRLLIAQAKVENLPILTGDPVIGRYDVKTVW